MYIWLCSMPGVGSLPHHSAVLYFLRVFRFRDLVFRGKKELAICEPFMLTETCLDSYNILLPKAQSLWTNTCLNYLLCDRYSDWRWEVATVSINIKCFYDPFVSHLDLAIGEGASAKTASQDTRTPQIRCFEHSSVCSLVSDKYNNVM